MKQRSKNMTYKRSHITSGYGNRLKHVRTTLNYSPGQMASKLGIEITTYYKNESEATFPGFNTLNTLQKDYAISIDWLLFNKGPMYFSEKNYTTPAPSPLQRAISELETIIPDIKDLLEHMSHDEVLRYETMLNFYKYKNKTNPETLPQN
jgi:transcriptional regulator with XRE-family HTH domain